MRVTGAREVGSTHAAKGERRRLAESLIAECERILDRWKGRKMPAGEVKKLEANLAAAERALALEGDAKMTDYTMPVPDSAKAQRAGRSPGALFAESTTLKAYLSDGLPNHPSAKVTVGSFSTKAVPTIGAGTIIPTRDTDVARTTDELRTSPRLRDVVRVIPTSSDAVTFIKITSALTQSAAGVAIGAEKPESTMAMSIATAPVRTQAVWVPVPNQTLSDLPQLQAIVDDELRWDLLRLEEYELLWGDGTGEQLLGIMQTPGVDALSRTPDLGAGSTVTLLDKIKACATDVLMGGGEPDTLVVHPIDSESLVLQKDTNDRYLNVALPQVDGRGMKIFGLRVVETVSAESYRGGLGTNQRVAIVGDCRRGAALYDREQATISVGFVDRQFIENIRTLLAEQRVAFAVKRPAFFRYVETVAASAS